MLSINADYGLGKVQFVVLSFEGPDLYSLAGGLGTRAKELASTLSSMGFTTHLYFVGDPNLPGEEVQGNLTIHRWCQWISANYPRGVYDGQDIKVQDLSSSWHRCVVEQVVEPAACKGIVTVFLLEEWQTVQATLNLHNLLVERGLERCALLLWNANNLYGFEGVNWKELADSCTITTVSRYMKHCMWHWGVNPIVIHNGIPARMLDAVDAPSVAALRQIFPGLLLSKVGRYDVDKRWVMAVQSVGEMKRRGMKPKMIVRGDNGPHRDDVKNEAARQGLSWVEIRLPVNSTHTAILNALKESCYADIIELCFFVPEEFIWVLFSGSDCVLANSGHEPFGLVGLEVMACGGVAFVGATGEDYAQTLVNSMVVETEDPGEIAEYMQTLQRSPGLVRNLRSQAIGTAASYTWECICQDLFQKIRFLVSQAGLSIDLCPLEPTGTDSGSRK